MSSSINATALIKGLQGQGDVETAEVQINLFGAKKHTDSGFVKMFNVFTEDLMKSKEITGKAIRLFLWIVMQQNFQDLRFYMSYQSVKEKLDISQITYRRWVKTLEKNGLIKRLGVNLYEIRNYTAIRGTAYFKKETPDKVIPLKPEE